jgi:hypothetical protein
MTGHELEQRRRHAGVLIKARCASQPGATGGELDAVAGVTALAAAPLAPRARRWTGARCG